MKCNFLKKFGFSIRNKFSKYNFSTISLITREGNIDRSENPNFNSNINWELSKVWITPHYNSFWNSLQKNQNSTNFTNDLNEVCKLVPVGQLITQTDFDRFLRKMGLTLSRDEQVYIQDGIVNGKKVRIISSDKSDAINASSIFQESSEFLNSEINILYLTDIAEVGSKRFVFYDKKAKVIVANTRNLENIQKVISELN
jgi:hypothetical protein